MTPRRLRLSDRVAAALVVFSAIALTARLVFAVLEPLLPHLGVAAILVLVLAACARWSES